ncbi:MAG: type II secretion system F family protein [Magnetococcales bacterium]|nr:type II secretion system F family protein [Magnetococcales bacterium]NGZ25899.1 type II secretion system F family protein [Magnetococcales bacterium]
MAGVDLTNLLIFTNQFSSMLRSHLALVDVLRNLGDETPHRGLREVIQEITDDVEHGIDLGDAMARHSNIFDDVFVNVVRSGMASGRLGESIHQMSGFLTKTDQVRRKVRSALSYPIFMLVAFFLVFNAQVFFILPRFQKMFENFKRELPGPTQILLAIGDFWKSYWWLIFIVIGVLVAAAISWLATKDGRYLWDKYKLDLPFVGRLWRIGALARFMRTLGVQVHNEVDLLKALELSALSCGNAYVEEVLFQIIDDIEMGRGISEAFREHQVFSGIVLQMISAGEESGNLSELLISAAEYFENLLDNEIAVVTGLINPVLTVFIGVAIAGMMVATFLPVFEMGKAAGH